MRCRAGRLLVHDRVERPPPIFVRIVHHDIDEHGHKEGQDGGTVTHLFTVDAAVPGRASMNELIAEHIQPLEHEAEDAHGIPDLQGLHEATLGGLEPLRPVLEASDSVVMLPERVEYELVPEEYPDGPGEILPDGIVDPLPAIKRDRLSKKVGERFPFARYNPPELFLVRICGIEGDPQEDEARIVVFRRFGSPDPTDRPVDPKTHGFRESRTELSLLVLQVCVRQGCFHEAFRLSLYQARLARDMHRKHGLPALCSDIPTVSVAG